jgi:hypothetical protein
MYPPRPALKHRSEDELSGEQFTKLSQASRRYHTAPLATAAMNAVVGVAKQSKKSWPY